MTYLRAEQSGDVKTAYRMLSIRSRRMIQPEEMTRPSNQSKSAPVYIVRDVEYRNGSAKVTLDATSAQSDETAPSATTCCIYMVREQGVWRVDMVRTSLGESGNVMLGGQGWFRMWMSGPERR